MFHLKVNDFDIIGASPELMVKIKDSDIQIRPIARTRQIHDSYTHLRAHDT